MNKFIINSRYSLSIEYFSKELILWLVDSGTYQNGMHLLKNYSVQKQFTDRLQINHSFDRSLVNDFILLNLYEQ